MWVLKSPREAYSVAGSVDGSRLGCRDGSRKVAYTLKYDLEGDKLRKRDRYTRWMSIIISNKYVKRNNKGTQCMISRINEFWSTCALKCMEYFSIIIHFAKWVKRAFYCRSTKSPRIDSRRWNSKKKPREIKQNGVAHKRITIATTMNTMHQKVEFCSAFFWRISDQRSLSMIFLLPCILVRTCHSLAFALFYANWPAVSWFQWAFW